MRMKRGSFRFAAGVVVVLLGLLTSTGAVAEPVPPGNTPSASEQLRPGGRDVLVLLDTSGSMNEKDSRDVVKITAAKSAIREQMQELPSNARLGFMTYADKGSLVAGIECTPAQISLPISSESLIGIGRALALLPKPEGGTPTGPALQQAADYLKSQGRTDVTIVLVSDGESNCGKDPCQVTRQLKSQNIDITVNTVGFDISARGRSELECIASVSGGQYLNAKDSGQLNKVLKDQLGSGLGLSLTTPSGPLPMREQLFRVGAKISVAPGRQAQDVKISLRDNDPSADTYAQSSTRALGNLDPTNAPTISWNIRPPSNLKLDRSSFKITLTSRGQQVISEDFEVRYTSGVASGSNLNGALKDFKNIVVLGDSYSSGEGAQNVLRPYLQEGSQSAACHRTKNQYAGWLYTPEQVRILACSGAVAVNLYGPGQANEPNQLDQLKKTLDTGYRPDAIFLSITGNDIGFGGIAKSCVMSSLGSLFEGSEPLATCWASEKAGDAYKAVQELLQTVPGRLKNALEKVSSTFQEKKLPTPPIIVTQYPNLLGKDPGAPLKCTGIQPIQTLTLSRAFKDFMTLQDRLNIAVEAGVVSAASAGVPVRLARTANAIPPSHNLCSDDPWFVPLTLGRLVDQAPESLHPNVEGHQAMAAAINNWAATADLGSFPVMTNFKGEPFWKEATKQWWPTATQIPMPLNETYPLEPAAGNYGPLKVNVSGGQPFSSATIFLKSTPQVIGQIQLDANGEGSLQTEIQAGDVAPGEHSLNVLGTKADGSAVVRSMPISIGQPFPTIFWVLIVLAVAAVTAGLMATRRLRVSG